MVLDAYRQGRRDGRRGALDVMLSRRELGSTRPHHSGPCAAVLPVTRRAYEGRLTLASSLGRMVRRSPRASCATADHAQPLGIVGTARAVVADADRDRSKLGAM